MLLVNCLLILTTMPRKAKKTPGNKKKGASSPRTRTISTRKGADKDMDLDGSFLQLPEQTVSSVPPSTVGNDAQIPDKSDAILAYLQNIDMTNQALIRRVNELETNKSVASTLQAPRSHSIQPITSQTTLNPQHQAIGVTTCDTVRCMLPLQVNDSSGPHTQACQARAADNTDCVLPSINSEAKSKHFTVSCSDYGNI